MSAVSIPMPMILTSMRGAFLGVVLASAVLALQLLVGFIGDDGLGAATNDFAAKIVAVIPFVGEERAHGRRERQNIGRRRDLAWGQMQDERPAERIAQLMVFCRAASARAADCLIVLPLFRRRHTGEL